MLEAEELTFRIRGCAFEVFRELGAGYLEKVYENALLIELKRAGLNAVAQRPLQVSYKGEPVGQFVADLVVEERVLLELKAAPTIQPQHEAQLLNYLKATRIPIGLLINFTHPKAQIKRYVL